MDTIQSIGLVGGGPELERLKAYAAELGITDYVTFTGRVPDSQMLEILNTADVCVNPDSANEMNEISTMNKIMEYMALGKPIVQRLGDLRRGRRSTPSRLSKSIVRPTLPSAVPGDLSFVLPYRYLKDILEMLNAMNEIMPGVASDHTLLYGVEVKLHTAKLDLKENLESKQISGLYAGGDGAGVSRGLVQAAASGVWIGRDVAKRLEG